MAYQNINQYNYRKIGLKPVNEITDFCLADDARDFHQEVIFSPLLIAEDDGIECHLSLISIQQGQPYLL